MFVSVAEYKADVEKRGGYFFAKLPAGVLGAGRVGGRFPKYSATAEYVFETAPESVQVLAGIESIGHSIFDAITDYAADSPIPTFSDDVEYAKKQLEEAKKKASDWKFPTVIGTLSEFLGVPEWLLVGGIALVGYAALRNAGVVPPLKKVFK